MNKIITLDEYFPRTGEPTIQVVGRTERGRTSHEKVAFDSSASSPAYEYIKTVVPREGTTVVLVNALGAYEAYDSNRNGDGFNARPYKVGVEPLCGHPGCRPKNLGGWIADEETIPYHYKSFERGGIFKHHCFPAGTEVITGDRERLPIEMINIGDLVETHEGVRAVTGVFKRRYDGPGVSLRLRGQLDPLVSTENHPLLVLRREDVHCRHGYSRLTPSQHADNCRELRAPVPEEQWVPAREVLPGDYLLLRPSQHGDEAVPQAFASLVGWVASEGNLGTKGIIQFTFSEKSTDDIYAVKTCLAELGVQVGVHPLPQHGTVKLTACSKALHAELSKYVRGVLSEKRLTHEVLQWDRVSLLLLLGAYIDGDGHVAVDGGNKGQLRIRSSSRAMLRTLGDIVRALGAPATLNWDCPPGTMVSPTNGKTYACAGSGCVAVVPDHVSALTVYSRKKVRQKTEGVTRGFSHNGYHLVQVTERDDITLNEDVFNLEVAGPHSFVADEVIVHNCNKDMTKSLGKILKAFWNTRMMRIELLLEIVNDKDRELVRKLGEGIYPEVSMGCFRAGTLVTRADGSRGVIEDIAVGDRVRTHKGRVRRVTELHRRVYTGEVYEVKAEATRLITCTQEHPFYVVKKSVVRERNAKGAFCWKAPLKKVKGEWKLAHELVAGEHYLLAPIDRVVATPAYVTPYFARLFGYYVAEGHVIRDKKGRASGIHLTCNTSDELLKEVHKICAVLGLPEPYTYPHSVSEFGANVQIYSRELAVRCEELAGCGAAHKRLDESVMRWAPELQREMLGAYINGDGFGNADGSVGLSTASAALANQWLTLLPRLGILASKQRLKHKAGSGFSAYDTYEFAVHIGAQWAQGLSDVCRKVQPKKLKLKKESRKIFGDYVVTPIRRVRHGAGSMPVFNFEVEEDESYVVEGLAVHNCKVRWDVCTVCGHRAPTRKQYCEHAAGQLRQIDPETGVLSAVLNPSPDWFDLSMVLRHADRIGNVMAKIAEDSVYAVKSADMGDKVARFFAKQAKIRKLSEIAKAITGQPAAVRFGPDIEAIREYRRSVLTGEMADVEPLTAREVTAMDAFSLPEIFSTLSAASAPLSVGETARVWLDKTGHAIPEYALDRIVALQPVLREVLASYPGIEAEFGNSIAVDARLVRPALHQKLGAWVEKRAVFGDWAQQQAHQPGQLNGTPAGPGYAYNAREPAKTDPLTMTDYNTGHTYRTTRGAAMRANDQDMQTLVGGAALGSTLAFAGLHAANPLGRAAAALGWKNRPGLQALGHAAMALPLGWAGAKATLSGMRPYRNPTYTTDQGVSVSGGTEFKGASVAEALDGPLGSTTMLHKLAWDYAERTHVWSNDLEKTLRDKIAHETPRASIVAFLDHPATVAEKAAALVGDAERRTYDSTEPPGVDLQRLAERIGALIL